ncbi:MAG: alpha/beta hydrolase [Clostridium sp.]|nr:alpha/beta hydrolase [Clostridium sp.]
MVIYGEKDYANRKAAIELAGILENAELQMIHNSGHEVNIEAPENLAEVLRDFFK